MKKTTRYSSLYYDEERQNEIGYRIVSTNHILLDATKKVYTSKCHCIFSFQDPSGILRQILLDWTDQKSLDECLGFQEDEQKQLLGTEIQGPELGNQFSVVSTFYKNYHRKIEIYQM